MRLLKVYRKITKKIKKRKKYEITRTRGTDVVIQGMVNRGWEIVSVYQETTWSWQQGDLVPIWEPVAVFKRRIKK